MNQEFDSTFLKQYASAVQTDIALSRYSHALCGGPAKGLIIADSVAMLCDLISLCEEQSICYKVLGGMSNVLVKDTGFDGLVILNKTHDLEIKSNKVRVDSGWLLLSFVKQCALSGLSGIEWAAGIPGSVGGAVYGNAGAFGHEICEKLSLVTLFRANSGLCEISASEMAFAYRSSILKRQEMDGIILSAVFELSQDDESQIQQRTQETLAKRGRVHIEGFGSLGSVFKNPPGMHAGELIEKCGLKGTRRGEVEISTQHGNFFVTRPGARSSDYLSLIQLAQEKVTQQFGIKLETEIEVIG